MGDPTAQKTYPVMSMAAPTTTKSREPRKSGRTTLLLPEVKSGRSRRIFWDRHPGDKMHLKKNYFIVLINFSTFYFFYYVDELLEKYC